MCEACGLLIGDSEQHKLFHESLAKLRTVVNEQTKVIKQISDALGLLAPALYDMAKVVHGQPPTDIAREIERALNAIKD